MGLLDSIKAKADQLDQTYNPFRKVADALDKAGSPKTEATPNNPPSSGIGVQAEPGKNINVYEENAKANAIPRVKGGPVKPGKKYVVGEKGPETFVPSQPGRIVPNRVKVTKTGTLKKKAFK
jgi:hypothetical protein